ncbi:hypothetical protein GMA12_05705 [Kocuria sediminis]|uniref:Uncharacterized protein n=1 Tax=Kocuria sediminis TaxID=1038857 RepID=A0A6N8GHL0_9MICC|nr:hypothetical protein [Kocuria sediminis]MUN62636.1 hypothetical protein [Kocuria sediminis]
MPVHPDTEHQDWGADRTVSGNPEHLEALVAEVDEKVRSLWRSVRR